MKSVELFYAMTIELLYVENSYQSQTDEVNQVVLCNNDRVAFWNVYQAGVGL